MFTANNTGKRVLLTVWPEPESMYFWDDYVTKFDGDTVIIIGTPGVTGSEEMGNPSMIWVTLFIIDFTSTWFRYYSIFLAGERIEVVQSDISKLFLSFYRGTLLGQLIIDFLAEFFIIC